MAARLKLLAANVLALCLHRKDKYGKHSYYGHHLKGVDRMLKGNVHRFGGRNGSQAYWQLTIIALLRDAVGDDDLSLHSGKTSLGSDVAAALEAISRRKGETRKQYMVRVQSNRLACVVKYYDSLFSFM